MKTFLQRLEEGLIRADGSMGFLLAQSGVPREQSFDAINLTDPHHVERVHRSYIERAEVDLIETNTFGANRVHLASFDRGYEHLVAEINRRGVEIAREAAGDSDTLVGGAIGPITHSGVGARKAAGLGLAESRAIYDEQITALGAAGVDCFMIETVHRHAEGLAALEIARERFPEIPVVFQIACTSRRGTTFYGDDVETLVRAADDIGAHVIGLNCFLDPAEMYAMMLEVREWTSRPLSAQPNIGRRTVLCEGVYKTDRSIMTTVSVFGRRLVDAGVRVIGGCCGMATEHISQMRDDLKELPGEVLEDARVRHLERFGKMRDLISSQRSDAGAEPAPRSRLEADILSRDPERRPVLIELDPPRVGKPGLERTLEGASLLVDAGVRYITVADNPGRDPRLARDIFATRIQERLPEEGELVLHVACADKTLVSFATEMESMQHLTHNVLVISGDPPTGDYAISSAPYDLRSVKGIRAYTMRNHGISLTWQEGLPPTRYYIGGAFNPRGIRSQLQKFTTKALHAGAAFCLTQPIFDRETLAATAEAFQTLRKRVRVEQGRELALFPGVMAITTERNARILRKSFGMPVPKKMLRELSQRSRGEQIALGLERAREVLEAIRASPDLFSGVYLIPQFHKYAEAAELLRETGWLPAS